MSTVRSWSSQVSCPLSHATRPSRKLRNPLKTPPPPRTAAPLILMRRHAATASVVLAPARGSTTPGACRVVGSFCSATHRPRSKENGGAGSRRHEQAALWRSEGCSAMEHGPRGWPAVHVCGATNRLRRREVKATRTGGAAAPVHTQASVLHTPRVPTVRQNVALSLSLLQTLDDSNAQGTFHGEKVDTGPCEDPCCIKTEVQRRLTSPSF
jgi:hypothetical protein